jgi:hypothetical protein
MNERRPGDRHDPHHRRTPNPRPHAAPTQARQHVDQSAEVVRLRGAGQLVTAVGFLLGYQPDEPSLVVVGVLNRRLVLAARIDLPQLTDLDDPHDLAGAWELFTRPLDTSGAEAVAVIGYTGPAWEPALHELVQNAPLPVLDLLRVHDGRWWSLDCPDPDRCGHPGCSPRGAPVTDHPDIAAPMIAGGAAVPGTRADLAAGLLPGPPELVEQVTERLRHQPARDQETLYQAVCEAHDARTGGPDPLPPGQAAVLLIALTDVHVRDACLAFTDDPGWWLWHDLITTAPPGYVAPVATLIALAAYQRGDGVMAAIATDHALADAPGYGLARLVQASLHHALPPEAISAVIADALAEHPLARRPHARPDNGRTMPTDAAPAPHDRTDHDRNDD